MSVIDGLVKRSSATSKVKLAKDIEFTTTGILGSWTPENGEIRVASTNDWNNVCSDMGIKIPWYESGADICLMSEWFTNAVGKTLCFGRESKGPALLILRKWVPGEELNSIAPGLQEVVAANGGRGGVVCRVLTPGRATLQSKAVIV